MISYSVIKVGLNDPDLHKSVQIALANVPVLLDQVEASYLGSPILDRRRLKALTSLLNDISQYRTQAQKKIDLVVFPEVSIPHAWQGMLVAWARKHNIGVICGLEHRVSRHNEALNEVLAALPYKTQKNRLACLAISRLKRSYSPEEVFVLENEGLKVPPKNRDAFQLIRWRGASFAIYNCYELASIEDRGLFKGKVDFIIGTESNEDVNYFSNIVESAARDLHCYVIQVNDSQFGDSRIVSPSKTEKMNPLRIKGGENLTFLTMRLDLKGLRDHQRKGYGLQKDSKAFKPTPPGIKRADVLERIRLGVVPPTSSKCLRFIVVFSIPHFGLPPFEAEREVSPRLCGSFDWHSETKSRRHQHCVAGVLITTISRLARGRGSAAGDNRLSRKPKLQWESLPPNRNGVNCLHEL